MTIYSSLALKIILISSLIKQGYSILFNENIFITLNEPFICSSKLVDDFISLLLKCMRYMALNWINHKTCQLKERHLLRLGYINLKNIDRLVKDGPLFSLTI